MIAGVGTDMVEVERIRRACGRHGARLLGRVLGPQERAQASVLSGQRLVEFVAGRFAAKEALAKALGCGLGRLSMNCVDVLLGPAGLEIQFTRPAQPPRGRLHVSLTHTAQHALAFAVWDVPEDCTTDGTGGI
ncbi:MAG: holo-ACP synthase [Alicyclobacillus sp.]|nr:holo-ACP synthase [Alicyclobacillus sp.]